MTSLGTSVMDIDAITEYMENAVQEAQKFPAAIKVIDDYRQWRTQLSWWKLNFSTDTAFSEAKYYRDKLNEILGRKLPATTFPADAATQAATTPPKTDPLTTPFIPTSYKVAFAAGAGVVVSLIVLKKFRVI